MNTFNTKFTLSETNSGTLYQLQEVNDKQKINYYAYEFSDGFQEKSLKEEEKIKNCKLIRQYVKQIKDQQNKRLYLFKYFDGVTLDARIREYIAIKESIQLETIKLYLIQILETLYYLHSNNILGRVFSTKNILDCQGQILFMDFGFGPKLICQKEGLELIAPPEIIKNFIDKEQYQYNIKVDSWLLGAVLYQFVKFRPIYHLEIEKEKIIIMSYQQVQEYYTYLQNSKFVETTSSRYPKEFCQFIQSLLTYDTYQRLSFLQIYKHDFIKNLNIPNYQMYLQFYEKYNEQELNKQISLYEHHDSRILATVQLTNGQSNQQSIGESTTMTQEPNIDQIPQPYLYSNCFPELNQDFPFPSNVSGLNNESSLYEDKDNIERKFVHEIGCLKGSKFFQIWSYIRMELFRFTFLELSAEEFITELKKKQFQLEHVFAYCILKMGYLILIELQKKINEDVCPWRCQQEDQQKWKEFQKEIKKNFLENDIKNKIQILEKNLKETYFRHCKDYIENERIDQAIRDELKVDFECFQTQKINSHSIYKSCSDEFLKKGYRQIIITTYKFLEREQKLAKPPQIKYYTLLLKCTICHLINRIFNLNSVPVTFGNILRNNNRNPLELITPNEIYEYVNRDAEDEKINDIKYIWKVQSN